MLRNILEAEFIRLRESRRELLTRAGKEVLDQVTVEQLFSGLRVVGVPFENSRVDPVTGVTYAGLSAAIVATLSVPEVFFVLLVGRRPTHEELHQLGDEMRQLDRETAEKINRAMCAMPAGTHPMDYLNVGLHAFGHKLRFPHHVPDGTTKTNRWELVWEDVMETLPVLPFVCARACDLGSLPAGSSLSHLRSWRQHWPKPFDYVRGFSNMVILQGDRDRFERALRTHLPLHASHEGGNASIFASRIIGTAHASVTDSLCGGFGALAGVLHGAASQETLAFIRSLMNAYPDGANEEQIRTAVMKRIESKLVIPGFGHAVLRDIDPRALELLTLGNAICPNGAAFSIGKMLFRIVPEMLAVHTKTKNPQPNVDLLSGSILYDCGFTNPACYTVVFALARALDMLAQMVRIHGLLEPLVRPGSISTPEVWAKVGLRPEAVA